ncbi:Transporter [Glutamicibacter creatinolyticus]|uniref:Transporter n=1 Tax=Glutamicibacter creatinolyticus TaxID=162496 RepID=A0A5B7WPR2_9MICC|nr:AmiS/UreI family transporter [Glutamicibacter creatinolyticus]QCY45922.1 Transporter [Glutamicibacter creatinolyticus]
MEHVGLVFVGVILLVNGLAAAGIIGARSTIPLNFLVGTIQVVLPTIILAQAGGDPQLVSGAWPSYLFGITYLWVGYSLVTGAEEHGFGWYCLFVAAIALYQALSLLGSDPVFAVIWLCWAVAWFLFFWRLSLGRERAGEVDIQRFTGWFLILTGIPSSTVPALFLMRGSWTTLPLAGGLCLAALVLVLLVCSQLARRTAAPRHPQQPLLPSTGL